MGIIFSHCIFLKIVIKVLKYLLKKIWPISQPRGNQIFTSTLLQVLEELQKQENSSQEIFVSNTESSKNFNSNLQNTLRCAKTVASTSYNGLKELYRNIDFFDEGHSVQSMKNILGRLKRAANNQFYSEAEYWVHFSNRPAIDSVTNEHHVHLYNSKSPVAQNSVNDVSVLSTTDQTLQQIMPSILFNTDHFELIHPQLTPVLQVLKDVVQERILTDKSAISAQDNGPKQSCAGSPLLSGTREIATGPAGASLEFNAEESAIDTRNTNLTEKAEKRKFHINTKTDPLPLQKYLKPNEKNTLGASLLDVGTEIAGSIILPSLMNSLAQRLADNKNIKNRKKLQPNLPRVFDVMSGWKFSTLKSKK